MGLPIGGELTLRKSNASRISKSLVRAVEPISDLPGDRGNPMDVDGPCALPVTPQFGKHPARRCNGPFRIETVNRIGVSQLPHFLPDGLQLVFQGGGIGVANNIGG
jgi:hypothetical protein